MLCTALEERLLDFNMNVDDNTNDLALVPASGISVMVDHAPSTELGAILQEAADVLFAVRCRIADVRCML